MNPIGNMTFGDPVMRSLGTLKLPEEDVNDFQEALRAYGFDSSAGFLRRCAYALIRHNKSGDKLLQPTSFQIQRSAFHEQA